MKKNALIILCGTALAVFIAIAALVQAGAMEVVDVNVGAWVRALESDTLTRLMRIISHAGQWFVYVPMAILLLVIPASRAKVGLPAAIVLTISAILNHFLKIAFGVPRPDVRTLIAETGYGFPSGHAMNGTAFIGICMFLFLRYSYKRPLKITVFAACTCFLLLTWFGRVYLGVHSFSDVVAGCAAGVFLCTLALWITGQPSKTASNCQSSAPDRSGSAASPQQTARQPD